MLLSLDQSISVQLYALNFLPVFAGYCRFLTVFSTVLAKILFAMTKTQPCWAQIISHQAPPQTWIDWRLSQWRRYAGHLRVPAITAAAISRWQGMPTSVRRQRLQQTRVPASSQPHHGSAQKRTPYRCHGFGQRRWSCFPVPRFQRPHW